MRFFHLCGGRSWARMLGVRPPEPLPSAPSEQRDQPVVRGGSLLLGGSQAGIWPEGAVRDGCEAVVPTVLYLPTSSGALC